MASETAAPSDARTGRSDPPVPRRQIAGVFVNFFALGLGTASIGAALPDLRRVFDLGPTGGSTLVSAYNLGALIAIVTCGLLRARLRTGAALGVLLAFFVVGAAGMGLAPSWSVFYASAPVAGCGYGGLALYLNSIVARRFAQRSFLMLMLINAVYGLGAIVGPLIVGVDHARPQTAFVVAAAVAALSAPLCGLGRASGLSPVVPRDEQQVPEPVPAKPRIRLGVALPFLVFGFLYSGMETGTGAWEATHLTWIGHSTSSAARLAALFWLGLCVGRFALPLVIRGRSPRVIIRVALLAALCTFAAAAAPAVTPYAYTLSGFCLAPVFPAILQWVAQRVEDNQAANSMVLTASMTGSVLLPSAIGRAASPGAPAVIPLFLVVFALCGVVMTFLAARRHGERAA